MLRRAVLLGLTALLVAPAAGVADLAPVHAERGGERGRLVDDAGREFLPHGVNVAGLAEYRSINGHPPGTELTEEDYRQMAKLGFDHVRLLVSWSRLEPKPGAIDRAYIDQVAQAVEWGRRYGIYSLIDMHQDAYGIFTAAKPGEICPPGMTPNRPWDGAPEWATLTGGTPNCNSASREISPSVALAFQNLWNDRPGPDGVGVQTHLVAVWRELAARFAGDPAVMGYDLLNEPNPGALATGTESETIIPFYRRAIAAIREVDRAHTIWVEPNILRSISSGAITMPFVSADPNLGYAPHIYGDRNSIGADLTKSKAEDVEWTRAEREAKEAGGAQGRLPVLIGEFGALDPPNRTEYTEESMQLADGHLIGWSHWVWKETCGNPHFGYGPVPPESLWEYDCAVDAFTGLKRNRVRSYARPYPVFANGRLTKVAFDQGTKRFEVRGVNGADAARPTEVSLPLAEHYGAAASNVVLDAGNMGGARVVDDGDGTATIYATAGRGEWSLVVTRADRPVVVKKCTKAKAKKKSKRKKRAKSSAKKKKKAKKKTTCKKKKKRKKRRKRR